MTAFQFNCNFEFSVFATGEFNRQAEVNVCDLIFVPSFKMLSVLGHLDTLDIYGVASGKLNGEAEFLVELVAVVLGFIDGFNPCAMWILLFLISMF